MTALIKNNSYNIGDYMFISDRGAGAECNLKVIFVFLHISEHVLTAFQ